MLAFLFFWGAFPQVEAPTGKLNLSLGVLVLGRLVRGRALLCTSRECSHLQPNPLHCPRGAPFPELLDILFHACLARSGGRPLGRLCGTSREQPQQSPPAFLTRRTNERNETHERANETKRSDHKDSPTNERVPTRSHRLTLQPAGSAIQAWS